MAVPDFFNSTVTVKQESRTSTPMGGVKRTYSTRIASLPCRIDNMDIRRRTAFVEAAGFGKMTVIQGLVLYCEASVVNKAIAESDRITLGARTFQVKGINNPAQLDRHLQIDMLEVV